MHSIRYRHIAHSGKQDSMLMILVQLEQLCTVLLDEVEKGQAEEEGADPTKFCKTFRRKLRHLNSPLKQEELWLQFSKGVWRSWNPLPVRVETDHWIGQFHMIVHFNLVILISEQAEEIYGIQITPGESRKNTVVVILASNCYKLIRSVSCVPSLWGKQFLHKRFTR